MTLFPSCPEYSDNRHEVPHADNIFVLNLFAHENKTKLMYQVAWNVRERGKKKN